jgi:hypothetical protein
MSQNVTAFRWSEKSERAAGLVAQDALTDEAIAADVGIARRTLERWKLDPAFAGRVAALVAEFAAAVKAEGIANRQNRVAALDDRWRRMQRVVEARAEQYKDVPGGDSGLLVRQVKLVKVYGSATEVDELEGGEGPEGDVLTSMKREVEVAEYAVDTGLLRELREHEKQAAQELGQWTEKREHSGELLLRQYVGVDVSKA